MNDLKLPPQNIEIEQSILCTILTCPEDELFELAPADFYRTSHQKIYSAANKIYDKLQRVDIIELSTELKLRG